MDAALNKMDHVEGTESDLYLNGMRFLHRRDYRSALRCFESALERARQREAHPKTFDLLITLGNINAQLGEAERARSFYQEVLHLQKEDPDPHAIGLTLVNLGNLCRESGEWARARARAYYLEAEGFLSETGNEQALALLYSNFGLLAQDEGALADAQSFLEKAIALHKKTGYEEGLAAAWLQLGRVFLQGSRMGQEAETCFNYASSHFGALGDPGGEIEAIRGLAAVYEQRKDSALAMACINRILEINRRYHLNTAQADLNVLSRLQAR